MPEDPWGNTGGTSSGYDPNAGNHGGAWDWFTGANNTGDYHGGAGGGGFGPSSTPPAAVTAPAAGGPWYTNPNIWNQIVNGVGAISGLYGLGRGSGSTPNVYPQPLTPSEQQAMDSKNRLFDYASKYVDQYLRGLGNLNPSWSPNSPLLGPNGGGGFMGGVKVPTIDFSKMPQAGGGQSAPSAAPQQSGAEWDEIKQYGPSAVAVAQLLSDAGMPVGAIASFIRSKFGASGAQGNSGQQQQNGITEANPVALNMNPQKDEQNLFNRRPLM